MNAADAIKKILLGQLDGYRRLHELLKTERQCLVDFKESAIEELSKEKDMLVLKLRLLEEERIRLVGKFASQVDYGKGDTGEIKPWQELTLMDISMITGDEEFQDIRLKLQSLVQGIDELNQFNKVLIDRSLNYLKNTGNFLRRMGVNPRAENSGVFLRREV